MTTAMPSYKGQRYPVEIINHCLRLHFRFPLSFREGEELMLERGVLVSYRRSSDGCATFRQAYADQLCQRRPRPGDTRHLDEVFIEDQRHPALPLAGGRPGWPRLDVLVRSRRDAVAAKTFFRRLLEGLGYVPRVLVTDKLAGCGVAHRELLGSVEHRRSKFLNNRAEKLAPTAPAA